MNSGQPSSKRKIKRSQEESQDDETMLGIRPRRVAHAFEDFSIFECNNGDAFEPLPMDRPRTEQQAAAITTVFQDSIRLLSASLSGIQRLQESQIQATAPSAASFAATKDTKTRIETANPLEDHPISEVSGCDPILQDNKYHHSPAPAAIGSGIVTDEAIRSTDNAEDQRISRTFPQDEYSLLRFRPYQNELWELRFKDLLEYRREHGHCCVPHTYARNLSLARWVKRQRYQFKLRTQGKESTMTNRRVQALEKVGFIWDSQNATWEERLSELKLYRTIHGHCEVPTHYQQNKKLATWVKCQRRQYKLFRDGKQSTLAPGRIDELNQLNFSWEMRAPKGTDR